MPKPVGEFIASPPSRTPRPKPARPKPSDLAVSYADEGDLAALMNRFGSINMRELPPISSIGIDVQGIPFSAKSVLLAGDASCVVAKLPDGSPIARRRRALIQAVNTLSDLDAWFDEWLKYWDKHAGAGRYKSAGFDSTFKWWDFLAGLELRRYNTTAKQAATRSGEDFTPILSVQQIPGSGPYNAIAATIQRRLTQLVARVIGWRTLTHYSMKTTKWSGSTPGPMEWQADIPRSTALVIAQVADIALVTRRIGKTNLTNTMYSIEFGSGDPTKDASDDPKNSGKIGVGSRVPLGFEGDLMCPNYDAPDCPSGVTMWDALEKEYRRACKRFAREQRDFAAASP